MKADDFIEVGSIGKSWGNQGQFTVIAYDEYRSLFATSQFLFLCHHGLFVPYLIEFVSSKGNKLLLRFEDINTMEQAEELKSHKIFTKKQNKVLADDKTPKAQFANLIGYQIFNEDFQLGKIKDIIIYPQQEIALVDYNESEIMIPLHEHLIKEIMESQNRVIMSLPDGILDL